MSWDLWWESLGIGCEGFIIITSPEHEFWSNTPFIFYILFPFMLQIYQVRFVFIVVDMN